MCQSCSVALVPGTQARAGKLVKFDRFEEVKVVESRQETVMWSVKASGSALTRIDLRTSPMTQAS